MKFSSFFSCAILLFRFAIFMIDVFFVIAIFLAGKMALLSPCFASPTAIIINLPLSDILISSNTIQILQYL